MALNLEDWKSIKGYEGKYIVNKNGTIKSLFKRNSNNVIPQRIDRGGYWTVRLNKNGHASTMYPHRIKAEAFIPNPENKGFVNHKDGIKLNNDLDNLEWVTHAENMQHAYKNNLISTAEISKKVIDMCTGRKYESIKEAAKVLNINYGTCRNYLNGNIKTNKTCLKYAA